MDINDWNFGLMINLNEELLSQLSDEELTALKKSLSSPLQERLTDDEIKEYIKEFDVSSIP